jgi:hypothetical protein
VTTPVRTMSFQPRTPANFSRPGSANMPSAQPGMFSSESVPEASSQSANCYRSPLAKSCSVLFEGANAYKAPVVCTNRMKSNC